MKKSEHCCALMADFIDDKRIPIDYTPSLREYYIPLVRKTAKQLMFYCPWCGVKLPTSLRDEWFDILRNEYSIDDLCDTKNEDSFLQEFKSDIWWKKRKL